MSPLFMRFKRRIGILPKVGTASEVFEELREIVFTLNHISMTSLILTDKQWEDLRVARDLLTVAAIEIGAAGRENGVKF